MLRSALIAIALTALTAVGATAMADDDDCRGHDYRGQQYYDDDAPVRYYRAPARVVYAPPRVVYVPVRHVHRAPRRVYRPPAYYYPAPGVYYPTRVRGYGGQPSLGIQVYIPLK